MKNIINKPITSKKIVNEIRICVMHRIHPEYLFDIWLPTLAPSEKLLKAYVIEKKMSWKLFSKKYIKEVINKNMKFIVLLCDLAKKHKIALLCGEKSPKYCHRSLIIKACKEYVNNHK